MTGGPGGNGVHTHTHIHTPVTGKSNPHLFIMFNVNLNGYVLDRGPGDNQTHRALSDNPVGVLFGLPSSR